jgi:hypothetical protein
VRVGRDREHPGGDEEAEGAGEEAYAWREGTGWD